MHTALLHLGILHILPFLTHDAMLAWYMLSSCVHLSVCLSQVGVLQRWLNLGSRKQHHTIAQVLSFSDAKYLGKMPMGHPQWGPQTEVG